ncbi:MAG: hypothetical protein SPJ13_00375, partial [Bacteroidales bacterium]|nr:hypothetical protein [Bacteroidales bacterium]
MKNNSIACKINKVNKAVMLTLCLVGPLAKGVAQVSHGGKPLYGPFSKMETASVTAQPLDLATLQAQDMELSEGGDPLRVGVTRQVDVDVVDKATRLPQKDGSVVYRQRVVCADATFLTLTFDEFLLPAGATLFCYDGTGRTVIGSFIGTDTLPGGVFYTQALPGSVAYIEYREPKETVGQGRLHLKDVTAGYKDLFHTFKGTIGDDGGCTPDVACNEGDGWCKQINSVACYTLRIGYGTYICSGALINNTKHDKTPYFLSANHCQEAGNVTQWTFYFNYEASSCNASNEVTNHTVTGATILAKRDKNVGSDFMLLRLGQNVPESYNPYWAGWDLNDDITVGCCIHHPAGDVKKISLPAKLTMGTGYYAQFVRVDWNNHGITEGGSSGSPLFNKSGLIIGQLLGGNSSCKNTYGSDYYGRISQSWTGGGTKATRLKDWLDPAGSGVRTLAGYGV